MIIVIIFVSRLIVSVAEEELETKNQLQSTDKKKGIFRGFFKFGKFGKKENKSKQSSVAKQEAVTVCVPPARGNVRSTRMQITEEVDEEQSDFEPET